MIDKKTLKQAINKFGKLNQIDKLQEEAQELALALHQFKCPTKNKKQALKNIYSELADMTIMISYVSLLFNSKKINKEIKRKMKKLRILIKT